jgi:AcrR family transcriptional regulator
MLVTNNKDAQSRRKTILDAALDVYTEVGYHEARISDIAKRAGIGKGTVYLYFPGKKELFLALIEDIAQNHLRDVIAAVKGVERLNEKLRIIAERQFALFEARCDLTNLSIHEMVMADREFQKALLDFRNQYTQLVVSILAGQEYVPATTSLGQVDKEFPLNGDDRLREAAVAFIGLIHGFNIRMLTSRYDIDISLLSERIVNLFLKGFERSSGLVLDQPGAHS